MKKNLMITAVGTLSACLILTGCTVTPKVNVDANVKVNGSEVLSENFSYEPDKNQTSEDQSQFPGGLDDDGRDPSEIDGQFPGGLDDDGPGQDEAVSVLFERENDSENLKEKAIISGINMAGGKVWTYETKEDYIGQVDSLTEIGIFDGHYIFVAFGEVICLDVATGKELWVNPDFKGHGISWTTNYEGDKLYLCGYFGPSLFVLDLYNGKTLNRVTCKDDDAYWAYKIEYVNETRVDVTYESNETVKSFDPTGPSEQ